MLATPLARLAEKFVRRCFATTLLDWLRNTVLGTLEILDGKKSLKFIQYFYDDMTINQSKVPRAAFSVRGIESEFLGILPWARQTELKP